MLRISKTALANADEVEPDPDEQEIMLAYKSGAPEYQGYKPASALWKPEFKGVEFDTF